MRRRAMAMALLLVATAAACGSDDGGATTTAPAAAGATTAAGDAATTTAGEATTIAGGGTAGPARVQPDEEAAACVEGKTLEPLALTVATGDPAFPPYVIDDDPTSGQGFESAVVYAVAGTMGIGPAAITWVRTPFEAAIAPGQKDYDFNIQQFGITPAREQVVTFSQAYYTGNQAILGYADSPAAGATTLSDYQDLVIGVAAGTTSLDFVTGVIQ